MNRAISLPQSRSRGGSRSVRYAGRQRVKCNPDRDLEQITPVQIGRRTTGHRCVVGGLAGLGIGSLIAPEPVATS